MDFWWFTAAGLQALLKVRRVLWWVFQAVLDNKHFPDFKTAEEKYKSQLWVKLKGSRSRDWQINLLKVTRTVGKTSCSGPRVRKIVSNCKHLRLWCPDRLYRFSVKSWQRHRRHRFFIWEGQLENKVWRTVEKHPLSFDSLKKEHQLQEEERRTADRWGALQVQGAPVALICHHWSAREGEEYNQTWRPRFRINSWRKN